MQKRWGGFFRVFLAILAIACFSMVSGTSEATPFDPYKNWKTIKTDHFNVHFAEQIEPVGQKAAGILEGIYPEITAKWSWEPWGPTEVIILDSSDKPSGLASVLPYNYMIIQVTPSDTDSSLAHFDDWLKLLLVHEFTHIVQIDAFGGGWWPFRIIFGKTISPSGVNPTWLREGMAQYDETIYTRGGRGRGSYSEMIVRTAILEGDFPPIDVADGLSWKWPGYKTAYVYGVLFVHWLVDAYGEEKFLELDKRIRKSILLAMINHQARNVYGKTFYELWREWEQYLIHRYNEEKGRIEAVPLTTYEKIIPSHRDQQYSSPTPSPDGTKLAYVMSSPHGYPQIRVLDLKTGDTEVIRKKGGAVQLSWSRDGTKLAYASLHKYKRYDRFFDLWVYDFSVEKKRRRLKRLTKGARARDPDFSPHGRSLVFVQTKMGTDKLVRYDFDTKKMVELTPYVPPFTQFANPRMSRDGQYIAVSMWTPDDGWRIYRFNSNGTNPVRLTKGDGLVIESRPVWSRYGKYVIFSSDETGISNLYRVPVKGGKQQRMTNVLTGVFQPSISYTGGVIAQHYHSKGFEIVRLNIVPCDAKLADKEVDGVWHRVHRGSPSRYRNLLPKMSPPPQPNSSFYPSGELKSDVADKTAGFGSDLSFGARPWEFKSQRYVAFGRSLFLPRFIVPNVAYANDSLFVSFLTGGMDALRWHSWTGALNYRTDANFMGWGLNYGYSRLGPLMGFGIRDYAVDFGNVLFGATGRRVRLFEHRRGAYAYIRGVIGRHSLSGAYFYEDHMPHTTLTQAERNSLNLGIFAGLRAQYKYQDYEIFPASISPENGRKIRLHTTITNSIFGTGERNEQMILAGGWREYIRLFRHNVLALRAAGGITWGDTLVQGTFGMGGAVGEGALASGGSFTYFPFRGLPVSTLRGTRAMIFSSEWRFPIVEPLRGLGTVPFFVKDIHGAVLVDYGNAWNAHQGGCDSFRTFFDDFIMSVGLELRGDFIIGHGLPIHGRLGYAIVVLNRDRIAGLTAPIMRHDLKYGMLVFALGTAF